MSRCIVALGVLAGLAHVAHADKGADCSYLEITATSGKQPAIDPELKPLQKKLTKRPFSSWNTFHKLSAGTVKLVQLKPVPLKLQKGASTVMLRDRSDSRLELTITMDGADGKRWLDTKQSVPAGDWTIWVQNVGDDGHIFALTCK
ncbi:MAG: hypothetical protein ACM31C_02355 [Acidobacteriota bacterium]